MGAMLPVGSPETISRATWAKIPIGMRDQHAGEEMANYLALISGTTPNPEAVTLSIATYSFKPMCFLTARETAANGIPTIELIHSIGNYVVALGQPDNLHGHSFAFVGETVAGQLPSTFLEPAGGAPAAVFTRGP